MLGQIIRRHRRSVQTDNRLNKLPNISIVDCQVIDGFMTKYSSYEHSHSREAPTFLPSSGELKEDLESLKVWRDQFKNRPISYA